MASLNPCIFHVSAERRLCLPAEIVFRLDAHAQRAPDAAESGGLLFGRLSDNNTCLTLCDLTEPFPGDVRNARGFDREDPGHQATATRLWQESDGEVACWGDWHTHAEPHPEPSALDLESWRADAKSLGDRFAVIVGTETIGVWEVTRDGDVQQLAPHVAATDKAMDMSTTNIVERYNVERAKAAYRAYGATTNFLNFQGNPMPEWDALPEKIRTAWVAAAKAAATFEPMVF